MKKKILIVILILVLAFGALVAYYFFHDRMQEQKLNKEFSEIDQLMNEENSDQETLNKKLNTLVSSGDYAEIEQAFKNYLKDGLELTNRITTHLSDEKITTVLTAETYKTDGPEFVKTKEYLTTMKNNLEQDKKDYQEFFTEDKAMSYLNSDEINLDSYYIDYYRDVFVGDLESQANDKTVENSIDEIINILNTYESVLTFLQTNQGNWIVEGETILFSNDELTNQYNQFVSSLA